MRLLSDAAAGLPSFLPFFFSADINISYCIAMAAAKVYEGEEDK